MFVAGNSVEIDYLEDLLAVEKDIENLQKFSMF